MSNLGHFLIVYLLEWPAKIYLWVFLPTVIVFLLLSLAAQMGLRRSQFTYYSKYWLFHVAFIMGVFLLVPVYIFQPRNVINMKITGWFLRKCTYMMHITWEIRDPEALQDDIGGIVCANHQSFIDILGVLIKGYLWIFFPSLIIFTVMALVAYFSPRRAKLTYYAKFSMVYFATIMIVFLLVPVFLFRPRNVINCKLSGWFLRKCSFIMELTWEIRDPEVLEDEKGGLICANHQSSLDILAMINMWEIMKKVTGIAKKEMMYVLPFGPCAWLCGLAYIDRKSAKASYETLDRCGQQMREENTKMFIFPEGTRNKGRGLLPFKRGAFKTAITAQIRVIPIVISPYYFIDSKNNIFDKGHVIIKVLKPIDAAGLTEADTDTLMDKTRKLMLEEYNKLENEIDTMSQDPKWRDKPRPRMTLVMKKD